MAINLKNYTTEVPADRSISYIEKLLVEFGALNIMKEYQPLPPLPGSYCSSISFIVEMDGYKLPVKLPANVLKVMEWLKKKKPSASPKNLAEQSLRIAWKQQYEILHLQLGQIEMNQIEKLEVFLSYLYDIDKNKTYYEKIKSGGFKALMPSVGN